ncbi:MAG: guanylate kinase [Acidobacteriota bacterium]|nr:guanylate kinase [Acidobacteriota bacterium]
MQDRGTLFVVSAPSGTGKTTLVKALVPRVTSLALSRSYTSRPPRPNERDGVDYDFVTLGRFEAMRDAGEFLEWAKVFGHLYGTSALDTRRQLDAGRDLMLVINVQGARQVQRLDAGAIGIFVLPPSPEVLQCRLRQRSGTHLTEDELQRRLTVARQEVECLKDYDYVVVNDEFEVCIEHLRCIILAERQSQRVVGASVQAIARSFGEKG